MSPQVFETVLDVSLSSWGEPIVEIRLGHPTRRSLQWKTLNSVSKSNLGAGGVDSEGKFSLLTITVSLVGLCIRMSIGSYLQI